MESRDGGRRDVQALVALCDAGGVRGCYAHVERLEVLAGAGDAVVILEGWVLVGCAGCSRQRGGEWRRHTNWRSSSHRGTAAACTIVHAIRERRMLLTCIVETYLTGVNR